MSRVTFTFPVTPVVGAVPTIRACSVAVLSAIVTDCPTVGAAVLTATFTVQVA
jgi:hypothetical protein